MLVGDSVGSAFQRPGSWWRGPLLPQLPVHMRPLLSLPPGHSLVRPNSCGCAGISQTGTVSALPQVGPSTEQPSRSRTPDSKVPTLNPHTPQTPSQTGNAPRGKPQPGAGAVGSQSKSKKKNQTQTDRQPKGSCDPIALANRYLHLPDDPGDVEMAEAAPRGNRSRSPKKNQRGPSPVLAPR